MITEEVKAIIEAEHEQWLRNPITQAALNAIRKHRESFVTTISKNASNLNVGSEFFRNQAQGIATVEVILDILCSSGLIIKQLEK